MWQDQKRWSRRARRGSGLTGAAHPQPHFLEALSFPICHRSELIRPSIPVMTHPLDQKVMPTGRKAKAIKCMAGILGNIQVKIDR